MQPRPRTTTSGTVQPIMHTRLDEQQYAVFDNVEEEEEEQYDEVEEEQPQQPQSATMEAEAAVVPALDYTEAELEQTVHMLPGDAVSMSTMGWH